MGRHLLHEVPVVGDHQQGPWVGGQGIDEHIHCSHVEVVRGLVEQQCIEGRAASPRARPGPSRRPSVPQGRSAKSPRSARPGRREGRCRSTTARGPAPPRAVASAGGRGRGPESAPDLAPACTAPAVSGAKDPDRALSTVDLPAPLSPVKGEAHALLQRHRRPAGWVSRRSPGWLHRAPAALRWTRVEGGAARPRLGLGPLDALDLRAA